jgi:very-short-patch-repair endonuclease
VLDNEELWACGLSPDSVMRRRRAGWLHLVHPGVYSLGHVGLTLRGRCLAAVKACGPGAALSHRSAAVLWGLLQWDEDWLPEVTVPTGHARKIPGIIVHRTRVPFEVIRFDAIPVTTPARTLIDLSSVLSLKPLRRAVREAMALKRVAVKDITAVRGRKGGAKLTKILADGYVPTRTELEDAVHDVIRRGRFEEPQVNRDMIVGGRWTRPDFLWPEQRLVVEADGRAWHDHRLAREDDAERQARLEAAGYRVLRVTWQQAIAHPEQTIARLQAALTA